jgi:hypothetical protein
LFDSPLSRSNEREYARQVLQRFMARAYRRPVAAAEVEEKLRLYDGARKQRKALVQAIKVPLIAVLTSPNFLYLVEAGVASPAEPRRLSAFERASRLSYFLWSSMPDDELTKAAGEGRLEDPAQMKAAALRLLADPRSRALTDNFAAEWLGLREIGANPPAPRLYPDYDRHLELSVVGESKAFFEELLRKDRSVLNFLRSDFVVINERLARHYGIPGVKGDQFRPVKVPAGVHRGGLVTQASMLITTSNGTRTSPVKRGVWVLRSVLGADPGLPVSNAGEIQPKVPGLDKATVRQRLEIHRQVASCARCHNKIDPLGLALENFDAAGGWRDKEGFGYEGRVQDDDPVIDASAALADGSKIAGVDGLENELVKRADQFRRALASKMLTYALGRELGLADQPVVDAAAAYLRKNGDSLRSLITFICTSPAFASK